MLNVGIDRVEEHTKPSSKRQKLDGGDVMEQILTDGTVLSMGLCVHVAFITFTIIGYAITPPLSIGKLIKANPHAAVSLTEVCLYIKG